MTFGLREDDVNYIVKTLMQFPQIESASIFGSRAKGTHKPGSDIDIAIYGEEITFDVISKLHSMLENESPMPYMFDIVDYTHLSHKELKEHIERVGKVLYKKTVVPVDGNTEIEEISG